MEESN